MSTTLRWVKASERLPESSDDIAFRLYSSEFNQWLYFNAEISDEGLISDANHELRLYGLQGDIEWLEEQKNDEPLSQINKQR